MYFLKKGRKAVITVQKVGMLNESTLHREIIRYCYTPGDILEFPVKGYFADIYRKGVLIEVQLGQFSSMKDKLKDLLCEYRIKVVYPIVLCKYIEKRSTNGKVISKRKSPKNGCRYDLFDQTIRIAQFIGNPNLSFELIYINLLEVRIDDGKGSYRRKGVSISDRFLLSVQGSEKIEKKEDFLDFLPEGASKFTNKELTQALGIKISTARKMTYSLNACGIISQTAKIGNEKVWSIL